MRRRTIGQVLVEVALAVVGLVVLGFVCIRVGQWVNHSMVERNADFQATRMAAATAAPGAPPKKFYINPTRIHLLGPDADSAGVRSEVRPSLPPPPCSTPLTGQINDLRTLILQDWRDRDELLKTNRERTCLAVDLDMAAGDPPAGRACEGGAAICAGNVCKSANWFWRKALRLQELLDLIALWTQKLADAQAALTAAQADLAAASAIVCPDCGTKTVCEGSGKDEVCHDEPDCAAHDWCEGAKAAAMIAAQGRIDAANSDIATAECKLWGTGCAGDGYYGEKSDLCAAVGTGNPEVGGAPSCDVDSIKAYAVDVDARAQAVNTEAQSVVDELHDLSGRIQSRMLLLEELERQARATCSSEAP